LLSAWRYTMTIRNVIVKMIPRRSSTIALFKWHSKKLPHTTVYGRRPPIEFKGELSESGAQSSNLTTGESALSRAMDMTPRDNATGQRGASPGASVPIYALAREQNRPNAHKKLERLAVGFKNWLQSALVGNLHRLPFLEEKN
jgi:hypothetical protein